MKIHLISYGDENYASQKEFLKESALSSKLFHQVKLYDTSDLDQNFSEQFESILKNTKGGGYWIWKPFLVNKYFQTLPKDDILLYCDAGCMINPRGAKRFHEYVELLIQSNSGSLAFELPHLEIEYTKQEVFDYFGADYAVMNANQLVGGIFFLRKCAHARELVDEWIQTLYNNPLLFTNDKNGVQQQQQFIKHKSDQSIFSVIRKTLGTAIIVDETYYLDFLREGQDYPIWAARLCLK